MLPTAVPEKGPLPSPAPPGPRPGHTRAVPCRTVKGLQRTPARDQPVPEKAQVVGALLEVVGHGSVQGDVRGHGGKVGGRTAQEPGNRAAFQLIWGPQRIGEEAPLSSGPDSQGGPAHRGEKANQRGTEEHLDRLLWLL